jgi:hypothetical protein
MDARQIIDALGGYRAVADYLCEEPNTVHNWTRRSIPAKRWPAINRMARSLRVAAVTLDVLERHKDKVSCP